jgi:hypothetical protein
VLALSLLALLNACQHRSAPEEAISSPETSEKASMASAEISPTQASNAQSSVVVKEPALCGQGLIVESTQGNTQTLQTRREGHYNELSPRLLAIFTGGTMTAELSLSSSFEKSRYSACAQRSYIFADGKQVIPLGVKYFGLSDLPNADMIIFDIDRKTVEALGTVKAISFKVCDDAIMAKPEFICALREFSSKVEAKMSRQAKRIRRHG